MAIAEAPTTIPEAQPLTPAEKRHFAALEKRIEAGFQTFREVGAALMEVRDSLLYRDTHGTFEDYCRERWQLDRNRAYQLIGAAQVAQVLGNPKELQNESQARELVPVLHDDPKQVKVIWERVKATTEPVTAQVIRRVTAEVMEPDNPTPAAPSATDQLVTGITRLIAAYKRWDAGKPTRKERAVVNAALAKLDEVVGE